jgi:hypothetical protein
MLDKISLKSLLDLLTIWNFVEASHENIKHPPSVIFVLHLALP